MDMNIESDLEEVWLLFLCIKNPLCDFSQRGFDLLD